MKSRNPNRDHANINAFINLVQFNPFVLKNKGNEIVISIKGRSSVTNLRKMTGNNPNLDLVHIKA